MKKRVVSMLIIAAMMYGMLCISVNASEEILLFNYTFEDYERGDDEKPARPPVHGKRISLQFETTPDAESVVKDGRPGLRIIGRPNTESTGKSSLNSNLWEGVPHNYIIEISVLREDYDSRLIIFEPQIRTTSPNYMNLLTSDAGIFKADDSLVKEDFIPNGEIGMDIDKWYDIIIVSQEERGAGNELDGINYYFYINGRKFKQLYLSAEKYALRPQHLALRFSCQTTVSPQNGEHQPTIVLTDYKQYLAYNDLEIINEGITNGAANVPCDAVNVKFSNKLDPCTLQNIVLKDVNGNIIPANAEIEYLGDEKYDLTGVVINPSSALDDISAYTIDVSGVEDLMGNSLPPEDAIIEFTTGSQYNIDNLEYDFEDATITGKVKITNYQVNNNIDTTLIMALYKDSVLTGAGFTSMEIAPNGMEEFQAQIDTDKMEAGTYDIKLFVWNDFYSIKPLKDGILTGTLTIN